MASMYQISVPVYIRRLNGLAGCLKKAQAHYAEKKYDETSLMTQRFFPDMGTLYLRRIGELRAAAATARL